MGEFIWLGEALKEHPILYLIFIILLLLSPLIQKILNHWLGNWNKKETKIINSFTQELHDIRDDIKITKMTALKNTVYNEEMHDYDRLEALLEYIWHGGNHTTLTYGIGNIILKNKEIWWSLVHKRESEQNNAHTSYKPSLDKIYRALGYPAGAEHTVYYNA
ncbi:MAG: hypothetical protein FWD14_01880 [Treponema sp.]|nr:hypothetical protein [Treponema sp.]